MTTTNKGARAPLQPVPSVAETFVLAGDVAKAIVARLAAERAAEGK